MIQVYIDEGTYRLDSLADQGDGISHITNTSSLGELFEDLAITLGVEEQLTDAVLKLQEKY